MLESFAQHVQAFITQVGYPGLFLLIVLESTMVPIPSELVMPFAGYLAFRGEFSLPMIIAINSVAAVIGSLLSYWLGAAGGKPLLLKYGRYILVRKKDIERTESFFARHGKATIFFSRFLPVIRHIISLPAGVARMPIVPFTVQTLLGATIWGTALIMIGYELGANWQTVSAEASHIDHLIGGVIVLALVVVVMMFVIRRRRERTLVTDPQSSQSSPGSSE
jgi:membrane protein DedA with SNARE-associated domain